MVATTCTIDAPIAAAAPFAEGMVTLTFDDGYSSQSTLAAPALKAHGFHATFYLISSALSNWGPPYLTVDQAKGLVADGHEIGSHTVSHPDLTTLSDAKLMRELADSQSALVAALGVEDVQSFASPYGAYDQRVLDAIKTFYVSHRTVGFDELDYRDGDRYLLTAGSGNLGTTVEEIEQAVDYAIAQRGWLVMYFHNLATTPTVGTDFGHADFIRVLDYLERRKVKVATIREGVALMTSATPVLAALTPAVGSTLGGTQVALTGSGFASGATVTFGGVAATTSAISATSILATTPAHAAGAVDVKVTNPDAHSATLASAFTYSATTPFAEGMVTLTFDDGYSSQSTLAAPALKAHGFHATFYLISGALSNWGPPYLTVDQAKGLVADGHEIGSHTVSHPDLTTLSDAKLMQELADSQSALVAALGVEDVQSVASPYGTYDRRVIDAIKTFYVSHRTVDFDELDYRDGDRYLLTAGSGNLGTTVEEIEQAVDYAIAQRGWLVMYFHNLATTPTVGTDFGHADFIRILDYLERRKVKVATIREGVALMTSAASALAPAAGSTLGAAQVALTGSGFASGAAPTFRGATARRISPTRRETGTTTSTSPR
ncbi:MAG: hypothetical protein A2V77_16195 [Anaeromyxobacter sp. RBG_16_69_14]|nr:MAG: hypothetical protein A2V77_16195 [Anaeromyxobacter sp. RBG_16_69_14]